MKGTLAVFLIFSLLLSGCGIFKEIISEPVTFYYLSTEYTFGSNSGVIAAEEREASNHRQDLTYLLALYLMGPANEDHRSPLPAGTRIINPEQNGSIITMELVNSVRKLSDADLSLACACLTLTCLDITDATEVSITYGEQTVTMHQDSLTLVDDSRVNSETEEAQ